MSKQQLTTWCNKAPEVLRKNAHVVQQAWLVGRAALGRTNQDDQVEIAVRLKSSPLQSKDRDFGVDWSDFEQMGMSYSFWFNTGMNVTMTEWTAPEPPADGVELLF